MNTIRNFIDIVSESFNTMMDLEPNATLEDMLEIHARRHGISNIQALSSYSPESHFVTFDYDGAREVHILGPGMTPYFTKNNPAPMRVFSTAINLVMDHAKQGGLVRLECSKEPEAVNFYGTFAKRARRMGYDVKFIPNYHGSSGVMVAAYEISKPTDDIDIDIDNDNDIDNI